MPEELQTWWQNTTPEMQGYLQDGSLVLVALLGGLFLGAMVARTLRARNFNAALRLPGSSPSAADADSGFTPTLVAGLLVRLTIWAGAAWWLTQKHGMVEVSNTLGLIITRTWALAALLVAALGIGSLLARRLIDCLQGAPKSGSEALSSRNGAAASRWNAGGAVGAGVYILVLVLILMIAADLFDWPLTRTAAQALWQFAQHLLVAGAALFIGFMGSRWARELGTHDGAGSDNRAGQYTALGIMAVTTVLAVAVFLSSSGVLIGLAALGVLGCLLWIGRGYLPDVAAGLQLRAQRVRDVWLDGALWQVGEVGLLTSQVGRGGEFCRLQNRLVLEARSQGAPKEAVHR